MNRRQPRCIRPYVQAPDPKDLGKAASSVMATPPGRQIWPPCVCPLNSRRSRPDQGQSSGAGAWQYVVCAKLHLCRAFWLPWRWTGCLSGLSATYGKGLWVGGPVPLGYRCLDKKLEIVPEEAETVRAIFGLYFELGSLGALIAELDRRGVRTKVNGRRDGRQSGGIRFGVVPEIRKHPPETGPKT